MTLLARRQLPRKKAATSIRQVTYLPAGTWSKMSNLFSAGLCSGDLTETKSSLGAGRNLFRPTPDVGSAACTHAVYASRIWEHPVKALRIIGGLSILEGHQPHARRHIRQHRPVAEIR